MSCTTGMWCISGLMFDRRFAANRLEPESGICPLHRNRLFRGANAGLHLDLFTVQRHMIWVFSLNNRPEMLACL